MWMSTKAVVFETNLWNRAWLEKIAKEMNPVLLKNEKLKWFKLQNFQKNSEKSVAKYTNVKIAKYTRRENYM